MSNPNSFPVPNEQIALLAASGVILNERQEILLFLRDDMPLWTNVGGMLEPGETFLQALHRETFEETGCTIDVDRFVGDFFSPQTNGYYFHEQVFMCRLHEGQIPHAQDDEGVKLRWFAPDALPVNMGPRFRIRIEHAISNKSEPAILITPQHNMLEFLQNTTDFSEFVDLDEWICHPTVMRKRAAGTLKFDPFN